MKRQSKAYLLAGIAVLFWSTMSSAFKLTLNTGISFLNLLLFSSFFSLIVLFTILLFQKKVRTLKSLTFKDLRSSAILGLLNPFLYYVVLFKAYELLMAQEAGTLNYTWPIVLVLLSIPILKQKINLVSFLAILISFIGIIVISTHGRILELKFSNPTGVALAVGSAIFWALYWLFNMKDKRDETLKIFLNICFGFFYILITILLFSKIKFPSTDTLMGAIYIGAFEMGITFVIWLKALKHSTTTAKVSNLIYLSPFIALIVIRLTVGEKILLSTIIGLILVVLGIILQKYSGRKQAE